MVRSTNNVGVEGFGFILDDLDWSEPMLPTTNDDRQLVLDVRNDVMGGKRIEVELLDEDKFNVVRRGLRLALYHPEYPNSFDYSDRLTEISEFINTSSAVRSIARVLKLRANTAFFKDAECKDVPTSIFFPKAEAPITTARDYCDLCPVKDDCLEFAIKEKIDHGIWGGKSVKERRKIKKIWASLPENKNLRKQR